MTSPLNRALLFGVIGVFLGFSTGVAAFGDAVNGALVFGPIGFVVGWLAPLGSRPKPPPSENERTEKEIPAQASQPTADLRTVEASINEMMPIAGRILASIWNLEMKALIAVGLMDYFVKYPWLFILLAIFLLAVFMPLGAAFSVTGIAAYHYGAKPQDQYLIKTDA